MNGFDILRHSLSEIAFSYYPIFGAPRRASVCLLVASTGRVPSICFIQRAKWEGDPWSEHIALPGGSRAGDESAAQTVRREVREEVGVSIDQNAALGPPPLPVIRPARQDRL